VPGSLAGFPGKTHFVFKAGNRPALLQIRSAARNFALRDLGLRLISSSVALTGFFVSNL
jgi:hypothetical protein